MELKKKRKKEGTFICVCVYSDKLCLHWLLIRRVHKVLSVTVDVEMFFSSMEEEKMVYIMTDCSKNVNIKKDFEIEICLAVHEKKTMFLID